MLLVAVGSAAYAAGVLHGYLLGVEDAPGGG